MRLIPVTALSSWIRCPRQFYTSYVLEIQEPPKDVMILGLIKHKLHEAMSQEEEKVVLALKPQDRIQEIFHTNFVKLLKSIVTNQANALRMVSVPLTEAFQKAVPIIEFEAADKAARIMPLIKQGLVGEELWNSITPKVKPEYSLQSKKLGLKGRIDRLEYYDTALVPVELKSGNPPNEGVWEGHRIQAASYALMLEDKFSTIVPEAIVHYVDHNSRRPVVLNPFLREYVVTTAAAVRACLESKDLPEGCGRENCTACKDPIFVHRNIA